MKVEYWSSAFYVQHPGYPDDVLVLEVIQIWKTDQQERWSFEIRHCLNETMRVCDKFGSRNEAMVAAIKQLRSEGIADKWLTQATWSQCNSPKLTEGWPATKMVTVPA